MENMTKQEARDLLFEYVKSPSLRNHHIATEAAMKAFAKRFNEDEDLWGLAGLLHDMDWEMTADEIEKHTSITATVLEEKGAPQEVIRAIKAHHPTATGVEPDSLMEKTLYYTEELTGLITAAALVRPDKKLEGVNVKSLKKKLKDKSFAKGVDREIVYKSAEELGMELEKVIETVLTAMQEIHEELGL